MLYTDNKYAFLENDNCIRFNPLGFQKVYNVEMFIEEDKNNITRITHDAFVKTLEVKNPDLYLVSVILWNFLINNEKPDLVLEQLAEKCRRPLEKLVFYVNSKWQITGLHNYNNIVERWDELKKQLEQEYTGEIFEKYIIKNDLVIRNEKVLLEKLKKDFFIVQFFSPIYNVSFNNFSIRNKENIKFLNIDYEIDTLFSLEDRNENNTIVIVKNLDKQGENYSMMPIDSYRTEYIMDDNYSINSIIGKFENHGRKFIFNIKEDSSIAKIN